MNKYIWHCGILAAAMLSLTTLKACATDTPPAKLSADLTTRHVTIEGKKHPLTDYLADLSKQIGRGIIADSLPLQQKADIRVNGTAQEALDKIADAFDYIWTVSKRGTILLNKRYKNPDELPQLNAAELHESARAGVAVLDSLGANLTPGQRPLNRLFEIFLPEQVALLQSGKPLKATTLTALQSDALQQATTENALSSLSKLWKNWDWFFNRDWAALSEMRLEAQSRHYSLPNEFSPGTIREVDIFSMDCVFSDFDGRESRTRLKQTSTTRIK